MYALQDRSGKLDLSQLRSLQDWLLRYELQALSGVAEVAPLGGVVKQYEIVIDPQKLRFYDLTLKQVRNAIDHGNGETGIGAIEQAEAETMLRVTGYIDGAAALRDLPLGLNIDGAPLLLRHIADINEAPAMRRGIGELNGEGETVGGIVVMRSGGKSSFNHRNGFDESIRRVSET